MSIDPGKSEVELSVPDEDYEESGSEYDDDSNDEADGEISDEDDEDEDD
jgi:hypothetical protein